MNHLLPFLYMIEFQFVRMFSLLLHRIHICTSIEHNKVYNDLDLDKVVSIARNNQMRL